MLNKETITAWGIIFVCKNMLNEINFLKVTIKDLENHIDVLRKRIDKLKKENTDETEKVKN